MIIYDLLCSHSHKFEGWFKTTDDFRSQNEAGQLSCPVCGTSDVKKLPTASRINRHSSSVRPASDLIADAERTLLHKIHEYVDSKYTDVGSEFPEQARKIHYGEVEPSSIRGTATANEAQDLKEEGVDIVSLPSVLDKNKLN